MIFIYKFAFFILILNLTYRNFITEYILQYKLYFKIVKKSSVSQQDWFYCENIFEHGCLRFFLNEGMNKKKREIALFCPISTFPYLDLAL